MHARIVAVAGMLAAGSLLAGDIAFSRKPMAAISGAEVRVTFAVNVPTDVEVAILGADGKIVRHLAAGMIGGAAQPPPPLSAGLEQTLVWDGKDDLGVTLLKPAQESDAPAVGAAATRGAGPFRVRVRAGLKPLAADTAFGSENAPNDLVNVTGLAMGPGGSVYVLSERWKRAWWTATAVHVFRRGGDYERTIKPFPATLPASSVAPITLVTNDAGRPLPTIYRVLAMDYYPTEDVPQHPAVTPDGNLHLAVIRAAYYKDREGERYLASLTPAGGVAYKSFAGPRFAGAGTPGDPYLASSSDGRFVFATGLERDPGESSRERPNSPVLRRIALPERGDAVPFFGDPLVATNGQRHLNDPRGLALDGKGRIYLADRGNDRVVILSESDGRWLGAFAVAAPTWVGVHRRGGAVYVATGDHVVKYALDAAGRATEQGRMALPALNERARRSNRWCFALDTEGDETVLWVGHNRGGDDVLLLCEEREGRFGALRRAGYRPARSYWNLAAGYDGKTVACKVGSRNLRLLDEDTGQTRDLQVADSGGQTYRLGPDNQVYGMDHWRWGVQRWTSEGKPLPFPATLDHKDREGRGRLGNAPSGTTSWERDFDVDRAGNVYVKHRGKVYHGRMRVDKYDRDGNFAGTVVWVVSDGAHGPRVDNAGNIYVADAVKPLGQPVPEFFKGKLLDAPIDKRGSPTHPYAWMYGSVIKFGPAGGAIWFPILADNVAYAFDGEAKLPASQTKVPILTMTGDRDIWHKEGSLQGAEWFRYGMSYILDMHPGHNRRCHCTATEFDVDDYGRTFYTDQGRFRVVVLDAAGTEIAAFGSYGNQDACATNSVAFNWFTGLAVSDRYVYAADGANRRVVRVALKYAAEENVDLHVTHFKPPAPTPAAALKGKAAAGWLTASIGLYPDATPVSEWGPDRNVLWATPMTNWGNASPVLAGERLFVTSEPDELLCVAKRDGAVLWRHTPFD
jgi:hypothetical protein